MRGNVYVYILVMAGVTYLIRMLPLTLIRGTIKSRFIRSFLYYVPYVTLAVMTFPAIIQTTHSVIAGACAFAAGIIAAWIGLSMYKVAACCVAVVFILEFFV